MRGGSLYDQYFTTGRDGKMYSQKNARRAIYLTFKHFIKRRARAQETRHLASAFNIFPMYKSPITHPYSVLGFFKEHKGTWVKNRNRKQNQSLKRDWLRAVDLLIS